MSLTHFTSVCTEIIESVLMVKDSNHHNQLKPRSDMISKHCNVQVKLSSNISLMYYGKEILVITILTFANYCFLGLARIQFDNHLKQCHWNVHTLVVNIRISIMQIHVLLTQDNNGFRKQHRTGSGPITLLVLYQILSMESLCVESWSSIMYLSFN